MNTKRVMKGTLLAAVCMAGMLFFNSSTSLAYEVIVSGDGINVRASASTESDVVATVNAGDRLEVISEEQDGGGNTWYQISVNNTTGYIRSDKAKKEAEAAAVNEQPASSDSVITIPSQSATVIKKDVNVRASASASSSKKATVSEGTMVTVTGSANDNKGATWYQVNFINNGAEVTGFIREDMLELGEVVEEAPEEGIGEDYDLGAADSGAEEGTPSNEYELVYTADQDGVDCWYINDYANGKRYKLEQLFRAEELNASNVAIMQKKIKQMRLGIIILAVLFVGALGAAGFLGYKYHELSEDDDDDDDDDDDEDDDDDVRVASPVRRRAAASTAQRRPQTSSRDGERMASRPSGQRRTSEPQRRPAPEGQRRPARTSEGQPVRRRPSDETGEETRKARPSGEASRRPSGTKGSTEASRRESLAVQSVNGKKVNPRSNRADVEWKSKNFLAEEDEPDFTFIDTKDDE